MTSYEDRIRESRTGLSPSFARLADFLLDSYIQAAFLTATELAHTLDIDPATVVRFSQRIGYPGYPALQREIRRKVKQELFAEHSAEANSPAEAVETAFGQLERQLELTRRGFPIEAAQRLVSVMDQSGRVIVLAEGLAQAPAQTLANWLEAAGYMVRSSGGGLPDIARAIVGTRKGDLVLALEVGQESSTLASALAEAKRAGAQTAALVAAPSSQLARSADIVLAAHASQEAAIGQVLVEAMVFALLRLLMHSRPGWFGKLSQRLDELTPRLARGVI